jgi:heavy metal efflux system protein
MKSMKILLLFIPVWVHAQRDVVTLDEAISLALKNNPGIQAATQEVWYQKQLKKTSTEIPKTEVGFMYGQYNSIVKDNNLTVLQTIPFPTVFSSKAALGKSQVRASEARKAMTENELIFQVKETFYRLLYLNERNTQLKQQDSLFSGLANAATKKLQAGEGTKLEMTRAVAQQNEIRNLINQNLADQAIYESHLQALLNTSNPVGTAEMKFEPLPFPDLDSADADSNPTLQYMKQQITIAEQTKRVTQAHAWPEFKIGAFSQTLIGTQNINGQDQYFGNDKRFTGLQVGISLPLWVVPQVAQIKASDAARKRTESEYQQSRITWKAQTQEAYQQAIKYKTSLDYYTTTGLPMANLIQQQTMQSFKQGEIGFSEFLLNMNQALNIRESYLTTLLEYNQSIIRIEFLTAQKK